MLKRQSEFLMEISDDYKLDNLPPPIIEVPNCCIITCDYCAKDFILSNFNSYSLDEIDYIKECFRCDDCISKFGY